jgi:hypothetical protein
VYLDSPKNSLVFVYFTSGCFSPLKCRITLRLAKNLSRSLLSRSFVTHIITIKQQSADHALAFLRPDSISFRLTSLTIGTLQLMFPTTSPSYLHKTGLSSVEDVSRYSLGNLAVGVYSLLVAYQTNRFLYKILIPIHLSLIAVL